MNPQSTFPNPRIALGALLLAGVLSACNKAVPDAGAKEEKFGSQAAMNDDVSQMNVVRVAAGSKDHTTLVSAVQAADLADVLASSGPYTVFAPTNAAFDLLPKGTVEGLLAPARKKDLANILQYHVTVPVLKEAFLRDGQQLGMANGAHATISRDGDNIRINDANVVGIVQAANGVIYVIDKVLLPPAGN